MDRGNGGGFSWEAPPSGFVTREGAGGVLPPSGPTVDPRNPSTPRPETQTEDEGSSWYRDYLETLGVVAGWTSPIFPGAGIFTAAAQASNAYGDEDDLPTPQGALDVTTEAVKDTYTTAREVAPKVAQTVADAAQEAASIASDVGQGIWGNIGTIGLVLVAVLVFLVGNKIGAF